MPRVHQIIIFQFELVFGSYIRIDIHYDYYFTLKIVFQNNLQTYLQKITWAKMCDTNYK